MSDGGRVGGGGVVRGEGRRLWGDVGEGGESCLVLLAAAVMKHWAASRQLPDSSFLKSIFAQESQDK